MTLPCIFTEFLPNGNAAWNLVHQSWLTLSHENSPNPLSSQHFKTNAYAAGVLIPSFSANWFTSCIAAWASLLFIYDQYFWHTPSALTYLQGISEPVPVSSQHSQSLWALGSGFPWPSTHQSLSQKRSVV